MPSFPLILASKLGNSSGEFLKVFHFKTPKAEQSCSKTEFKLKIDDIVRKFKSLLLFLAFNVFSLFPPIQRLLAN